MGDGAVSFDIQSQQTTLLEKYKMQDKLVQISGELIQSTPDLCNNCKERIKSFFSSSLCLDLESRVSDVAEAMKALRLA
jgi:hypothetical protein